MCVIIIKQKGNVMSQEVAKTSARINPHGLGIVWLDTFEVEYHKSSEYKRLITKRPFIAHFRYATVGAVNKDNTHPFVCGANKDELLMMNGTIKGLGNAKVCDSKALAINLGRIPRQDWKKELEQYDCRFVTINTRTRSFHSYLTSSKFVGSGKTLNKYPLLIQGLPYMVDKVGVGHNVEVDVFKVSDSVLENLDRLEGHPQWYKRKEIFIKMKSGKTLKCWLYFNPKDIKPTDTLHSTYVQNTFRLGMYEEDDSLFELDDCTQYDIFDDEFDTEAKPTCVECYHDLEHDAFSNYHCLGCGAWYTEAEARRLIM